MIVRVVFLGLRGRPALQEFPLLPFFFDVIGTFWIEFFHFLNLSRGQSGQVADEAHEFPGVLLAAPRAAPTRHAAQADAVFNDVEEFAIGFALSGVFTHIGAGGYICCPSGIWPAPSFA